MTGEFADLTVRVTSHLQRPLPGAHVTAARGGRPALSGVTDGRGRLRIERSDDAELVVHVEAPGMAGETRTLPRNRPEREELFLLGPPGLPFYHRGRVRVPFEPVNDSVGVLLRDEADQADGVPDRAGRIAERLHLGLARRPADSARSGTAILSVRSDSTDGVEALLRERPEDAEIEQAGALVALSDRNASFLSDAVVARFVDGLDDERVAVLAGRHGFTLDERIDALGNVHRLRIPGPASYAVLDAANALAEETDVVYAEPDLIHTAEDDAVLPTDFLFPQQWDHPIIDTPSAWEALRRLDVDRTFGSPDVIIAVVDTGVDVTHPEFTGSVSNGEAKLHQVFDFARMSPTMDHLVDDHGTACASAATARADNGSAEAGVGEGIAGVAGNCRLMAVRRGGPESRYAQMYLWIAGFPAQNRKSGFPAQISPGADIISSSFGSSIGIPISGLMSDTFDTLTDSGRGGRGTVLFFSSGNRNRDLDTTLDRPWGMYPRCFCVAASTLADDGVAEVKARYSSFGSTVDFCAPSNDNEGAHSPPRVLGAYAATVQGEPRGDAVPGRADRRTMLGAPATAGAATLTLASVAGMTAGNALLIGAPGRPGTEARLVTAVDAAANSITVDPPLTERHEVATVVASGPRSYQTGFGGTSYATPVCAGIAALMLSAAPDLRWDEVGTILRETAVKIDPENTHPVGRWRDGSGRISTDPGFAGPVVSEFYGHGRVDAGAAVGRAVTG